MRILHIMGSLECGGQESMVMNLYRHIDRTKIQFDFLITVKNKNYYEDEALALGARIFHRPMRSKNPVGNSTELIKILKAHPEIQIIHIHNNTPIVAVDTLLAKLCGDPVRIVHSHSERPQMPVFQQMFRLLLRATATHWLGCSDEAGIYLFGKQAKNNERFMVWPNACDLSEFSFHAETRRKVRAELNIDECFVAISVGRLHPGKNQLFLLDVTAQIIRVKPDFVLLIAGEGEMERPLKEKAALLGIEENVRFLGLCGNIPEVLQAADIFLFPSFYEGFSIVALEAQACGLPCILANTIPKACAITDLVSFLPIDSGTDVWAVKILACKNADMRNDKSDEIAQAGYDIRRASKRLEQFYLDALNQVD